MADSRKVKVDFSLEDMDLSEFKGKATYEQIKTYVLEETGLKVSSLYIAQIKKKCGLDVGENFNLAKSENTRQPQCTPEKEDAIMQAFRHFGIIQIVDKQHCVKNIVKYGKKDIPELQILQVRGCLFWLPWSV